MILGNPKMSEFEIVEHVGKGGVDTNPDYPFNKFLKILNMGSISFKNMKWSFGNMGSLKL